MPRKSSSHGVINYHVTTSQHQIGLRKAMFSQIQNNLYSLRAYIDNNLKPQFIDYYFDNSYILLDDYITNSTSTIKTKLTEFSDKDVSGGDISYLAALCKNIIDIVIKSRNEFTENSSLISTLKNYLNVFASGTTQTIPAPINGIVDVNVSIDEKYLKYIQMFGTPMNGIFDEDKLQQAQDALNNP